LTIAAGRIRETERRILPETEDAHHTIPKSAALKWRSLGVDIAVIVKDGSAK
jgi:hypothetical protein